MLLILNAPGVYADDFHSSCHKMPAVPDRCLRKFIPHFSVSPLVGYGVDPADVTAHVGNKIPDAPEVTFNGLVRYERPVSDSLMGTVMMDFNWVDNTYKNIDNNSYLAENAYWLVNGRISLSSVGKTWEVTFLAKNIFNKLYFRQRFDNFGPGWIYETPGAPLSYGINFRYNWR